MELNTLLYLALMIFFGMAFGRLAKHCKLPNVTGYLVAGLVLGPVMRLLPWDIAILPESAVGSMSVISSVALGFIAFSIGGEFKISYFKKVGSAPVVIAVFESFFAVVFVVAGLLITGSSLPFALSLGAIAAATAPAATVMVIRQYQAKGPVTETLLSVVAIDDATALIFFSAAVSVAKSISGGEFSFVQSVLSPMYEIFGALIVGSLLGMIFIIPLRYFKKPGNRLSLAVGFVFAGVGIAELCGFSSLLLCMALGASLANFSSESDRVMALTDSLTPPIFILFFVLSGADLDISALPGIGIIGVVYLVFRIAGKIFGTFIGAKISKADKAVSKYLGPALIPQAGVAIGLSLAATQVIPEHGGQIRAIILCATFIYELIGPAVTKLTLTKAGEIK